MCGGCNPTVAFSWIGAILVNSSMVALISWSTANWWPVGAGLASLYSALLFWAAYEIRRRQAPSIALNMVLLLAVACVGVVGVILAYNLVGCGTPRSTLPPGGDTTWAFDDAGVPSDVAQWAATRQWESGSRATYAVDASSGATLFVGRGAATGSVEQLWRATASGAAALDASLLSPQSLVAVPLRQRVCFSASRPSSAAAVHCYAGDGSSFTTLTTAVDPQPLSPGGLLVDGSGRLWFKGSAPFGVTPDSGVVYRADASLASATLLSTPQGGSSFPPPPPPAAPGSAVQEEAGCDEGAGFRMLAVAMLFLATLPTLATAAALWYRLGTGAASMSLATFAAASALVINVYAIAEPDGRSAHLWIKWWFFSAGFAWLAAFGTLHLTGRVDGATLGWAVNTGCLAYGSAVHAITEVPFASDWWRWLAYNCALTVPTLLLALVVSSARGDSPTWLPLFIGALGLLMVIACFIT